MSWVASRALRGGPGVLGAAGVPAAGVLVVLRWVVCVGLQAAAAFLLGQTEALAASACVGCSISC